MEAELLANKPRDARGNPYVSDQHWAAEIVRATLIEFTEDARNAEPSHGLPGEVSKALRQLSHENRRNL